MYIYSLGAVASSGGAESPASGLLVIAVMIVLLAIVAFVAARSTGEKKAAGKDGAQEPIFSAESLDRASISSAEIAAIAAAIAAFTAQEGARLVVRSVKRVGSRTPWQQAAREEALLH